MSNNQKSENKNLVQTFYSLVYKQFTDLKEYINRQDYFDEELENDNFISYFDKCFIDFVKNGDFVNENGDSYLEFHTEKEENFVFVNTNIKKLKNNYNRYPFKDDKKNKKKINYFQKLAEEMGYDYKYYPSQNENNNKITNKKGFRIPYSDFEREIKIFAFEKLNRRVNKLEKEKDGLEKEKDGLEKAILSKKKKIRDLTDNRDTDDKTIEDLKKQIKNCNVENERLKEENGKLKPENITYKLKIDEYNKNLAENKKLINSLVYKIKKTSSEFEKFKKHYGVVIYNIWRMGRTIEKDYKFNKQNFETIINLLDLFGKNLENITNGFDDKRVDLEFIENQKLLINESIKLLEKSYKQYSRVLILLEKSGIRIEEYDDIKDEEKLNVTKLDVIESSEVQEILVETVKPSIYFAEKRIFEGEVILTRPKDN